MKQEILFLNVLRFFAALNIVYVHLFDVLLSAGYLPSFLHIFSTLAQYGYLGVDLFLMISGFVIVLSSEGRTLRQFISSRFIRLYPVFWVCVSITTLFTILLSANSHITLSQYLANLTMSPDTYGRYGYIDGSYWTLVVELKFYFFIAVLLGLRRFMCIDIQKVALGVVGLLAAHLFFNSTNIVSPLSLFLEWFFSQFFTGYAQYFMAGILFYGLYNNTKRRYHYLALVVCYVAAIAQALSRSYETNNKMIVVLYVTSFFGLFLMMVFRKVTNESFSFLGTKYRKIIIMLGAITYPLYLLHDTISKTLVLTFTEYSVPPYLASPLLFTIVISLVLLINRIDFYIHNVWKGRNH